MEGMVTRKVELRGIGVFSTFKIYFAITLIVSLISYILINLFGMQILSVLMGWMGHIQQLLLKLRESFPMIFENEILSSLMASILMGLVVGLVSAISAAIFSFFALVLGGISIKIREKNPEKKASYL